MKVRNRLSVQPFFKKPHLHRRVKCHKLHLILHITRIIGEIYIVIIPIMLRKCFIPGTSLRAIYYIKKRAIRHRTLDINSGSFLASELVKTKEIWNLTTVALSL
ncbi:hypothetical protein BDV40DRAFT_255549 [Aspergillus tamarii]|uniref:Uncharacterized protein n=1 Tax=Aspergillus tamarii TaxID=41984 RepID=A0A5N6V5Y0_ASPTM|nr:hypothetical protein BDV40DRAFT_255549 [Aspergillus tamarii]